jgi:hypothetical protein
LTPPSFKLWYLKMSLDCVFVALHLFGQEFEYPQSFVHCFNIGHCSLVSWFLHVCINFEPIYSPRWMKNISLPMNLRKSCALLFSHHVYVKVSESASYDDEPMTFLYFRNYQNVVMSIVNMNRSGMFQVLLYHTYAHC